MTRKIKMGMIGGSHEGFIGAVHRWAANLDGMIELVCGCFSSNPDKSKHTGKSLYLSDDRVYANYIEMIEKEKLLPNDEKMQFVSIVTPNHVHFAPSKLALENGFHVVLDKPMTFNLQEALELEKVVQKSGLLFCLTHTYTGYPMIKEAKQLIQRGDLGKIRKAYVEYPQGWLSTLLESENQKQASWRTDPTKSGIAGSMGDIGTHAFNILEYVTGLLTTKICADINIVVDGRRLDDDGAVLLKLNNQASAVLMASQIVAGEENNLKLRVYGEKGGIEWSHQNANSLFVKWLDRPTEILRAGTGYLSSHASHNTRVPAGHPEGYIEAFANLYRNFALTLEAKMNGIEPKKEWKDFPNIHDGLRGMKFVESVIQSAKSNEKWTAF